jgi:hypothetical protein
MTTKAYNSGRLGLADGTIDWDADSFYAILVDADYVFSAAHTTYADVSAEELADPDYGPQALSGKTVALVDTDDVLYDCDNISFGSNVSIDASGGHLLILQGSAGAPQAADLLVFAREMADPSASTNSEFTITVPNGIYRINAT